MAFKAAIGGGSRYYIEEKQEKSMHCRTNNSLSLRHVFPVVWSLLRFCRPIIL